MTDFCRLQWLGNGHDGAGGLCGSEVYRSERSGLDRGRRRLCAGKLRHVHRRLVSAVRPLVPYIRQPSLIVHPLEDDYAGMSNATYLRSRLSGPVELVVLDDCYHIVTVDRQRHLVVEAIDKFARLLTGAVPLLPAATQTRAVA